MVNLRPVRIALRAGNRLTWQVVCSLLVACGGDVEGTTPSDLGGSAGFATMLGGGSSGGGGNAGGSRIGRGGTGDAGLDLVFAGGPLVSRGGWTSTGGAAGEGQGDPCPVAILWEVVANDAGAIRCNEIPLAGLPEWMELEGTVTIDGEGRIVDKVLFGRHASQDWLDGVSVLRFPCLAGQTIEYVCHWLDS